MIVRSYTGRTVPEALERVRNELGENALIIETRVIKEPGLLGRKNGYEVVAARDDADPVAPRAKLPEPRVESWHPPKNDPATTRPRDHATAVPSQAAALRSSEPGLEAELAGIRRELARLAQGTAAPRAHLGDLAARLEEVELPTELIAECDDAVAQAGGRLDPERRQAFVRLVLSRSLPPKPAFSWDDCRRLLVVGPTGVGKTTTIAKLAGDLVRRQNRRVALITIDTYRVGAQDQLRAYADLLDIPLEVADTPARLGEHLRRFEDYDHVLIDTAGRSPADSTRVLELKGFCRAAPGIQVMLAAAANAGRAEFAAVVERFSVLPIVHTVITKLDECAAPGRLYGCLRRHRLPVAFYTTGQEVPKDIMAADASWLAERVVGDGPGDGAGNGTVAESRGRGVAGSMA